MPHVFISHSTLDRTVIEHAILPCLEAQDISAWYSKDSIQTAAHWERNIVQGLNACEWFLVVLSPRSAKSEWVRDEVHWAIQHRPERIVPVLIEACNLEDFHLRMPRIQFIDLRADLTQGQQRLGEVLKPAKAVASAPAAGEHQIHCLTGHGKQVECVAFCPDSRRALSGGHDGAVRLWDLVADRELRRFTGHRGVVSSLAVAPDGKRFLSGSSDRTMRLWEIDSGAELGRFEGFTGWVLSIAFAPDGKHALSGAGDTTLRWWDLEGGQELRRFMAPPRGWVLSVATSTDGRVALSGTGHVWQGNDWVPGSEHAVRLWDLDTGQLVRRFEGHTDEVWSVAFSRDDRQAISGSPDKTIRLWHVKSGKEVRRFEGHTDKVFSVAFSPDGGRIVSGSGDETVRIWDVATGRELACLLGHQGDATSVAFSPDGRSVLSGSEDGTVRYWRTPAPS